MYGKKLKPTRMLKTPRALKGERREVVITHNPSTISPGQTLMVKFPPLGVDDAVVPGTAKLAFKLVLDGARDPKRVPYNNVARNLVRDIAVRLQGHEILSYRDANVYHNFKDNWLNSGRSKNMVYRGIEPSNVAKLRTEARNGVESANDGKDKAIADAYGNRYCIPLDVDILTSHHPFYPSGFKQPLTYEITFNDNDKVVDSTDDGATYAINDIVLEFEAVTNRELARTIAAKHKGVVSYLFDRIHLLESRSVNKSDTIWNIPVNQPIKSLKGILFLFKDPSVKSPQRFYNPKVDKTSIVVEGKPNQLYSQGMRPYQHWAEAKRFFGDSDTESGSGVVKDLDLSQMDVGDYLKNKFGLWLDFRSNDDNEAHGSGRRISDKGGISIQLERQADGSGALTMYVFLVMDCQLAVEDGHFKSLAF